MQKVQARHAHHGQCWCAAEAAHQAAHARGDAAGQRPLASTRAEVMAASMMSREAACVAWRVGPRRAPEVEA